MLIFDQTKQAKLFRVNGMAHSETSGELRIEYFHGVKETERGYWVLPDWDMSPLYDVEAEANAKGLNDKEQFQLLKKLAGKNLTFILKDNRSRLCRTTFESALESFKYRKNRQIKICEAQLASAKTQRSCIDALKPADIDRLKLLGRISVSVAAAWEPNFNLHGFEEDD